MNIILPKTFPVACHTDFVGLGSIFVAIKGYNTDGVKYIPKAIEKGATKIVIQNDTVLSAELLQLIAQKNIKVERVIDTRLALAQLSAQAAGHPAQQLKIIGVTGTKGKTTTVFLLEHIMRNAGLKVALISTVNNKINNHSLPPSLTTPQPDYLHQFLKLCVDAGIEYVIMEVAAQALTLHRVTDIKFDGIIFTNLALEHLEFYDSMEDYFAAKCTIFDQYKKNVPCLVNADDEWGARVINERPDVLTFGMEKKLLNFSAQLLNTDTHSLVFQMMYGQNNQLVEVASLLGRFNIYNVVAALAMAFELGIDTQKSIQSLKFFPGIRGRLEQHYLPNGARCIIDYAHNPLSYQAVLSELRKLTDHLIVVFGAGGQRDASRRPHMGAIAAEYADFIVLTSDNPRTEDPQKIIDDIVAGIAEKYMHKVMQEIDRKKAIQKAYKHAQPTSIIAILGKGPDEYQIIGDTKMYFSEAQIIKELR